MASISEVKVTVGYTHNLGNYESLRLDVTESRIMAPGEDANLVYSELWKSATAQLFSQFMEFRGKIDSSGGGAVHFLNLG
jgi:hypothetical protein